MPLTGDHAKRWRVPRTEPWRGAPCNTPDEVLAYLELVAYLARHRHDVGLTNLQLLTLGQLVGQALLGHEETQAWNLGQICELDSNVLGQQLDGLVLQGVARDRRMQKGNKLVRMVGARADLVEGTLHDPALRPIFDLIIRTGRKLEAARARAVHDSAVDAADRELVGRLLRGPVAA